MPVSRFHDLLQHFRPSARYPGAPAVLGAMASAPKFVFTDEVTHMLDDNRAEYMAALASAAEAGMLTLPHDPMLVEYPDAPTTRKDQLMSRNFWLIESAGDDAVFGQYRMRLALVFYDDKSCAVFDGLFAGRINSIGFPQVGPYLGKRPSDADQREWTEMMERLQGNAHFPLFYAMALHVRGIITRPARPVDQKLDRARAKRGLPAITKDYVTVHIGYVEDPDGNRHDVVGEGHRHVQVHLRRGHIRNQPCGPGREDRKNVWIKPVLVNWHPGLPVPATPDYLVVP